jgi:hypothetical protein
VSVGRGNRKTRKVHAAGADYRTACDLYAKRRYVHPRADWRAIGAVTSEKVNCTDCLKALVDLCAYPEFLVRSGVAKPDPQHESRESQKPLTMSSKMLKIEMRITEDQYKALEFACRYIPTKGKLSSVASHVLRLMLLNAKPDGDGKVQP